MSSSVGSTRSCCSCEPLPDHQPEEADVRREVAPEHPPRLACGQYRTRRISWLVVRFATTPLAPDVAPVLCPLTVAVRARLAPPRPAVGVSDCSLVLAVSPALLAAMFLREFGAVLVVVLTPGVVL